MTIIETQNLVKIYEENGVRTKALNGINFKMSEGEYIAIMGPSGSGKSTLLHILGCLEHYNEGQYLLFGKEVSKYQSDELASLRNETFGFVFQNFNLLPRFNVLENVKLPLLYSKIKKEEERAQRAKEMIELVDLTDHLNFPASKLSGGQKQRVAIARALVNNPKIILADEPTGSLDSQSGETVLAYFEKMHQLGKSIIIVTHDLDIALCSQRIIHLKDGLVISEEINNNRRIIKIQK